jgi:hypothetical protein
MFNIGSSMMMVGAVVGALGILASLDLGPALIGLAAVISALGALFSSIRNGQKVDTLTEKSDQIHVLVNSNLTAVKSDLAAAQMEIRSLREIVVKLSTRLGDLSLPPPPRAR